MPFVVRPTGCRSFLSGGRLLWPFAVCRAAASFAITFSCFCHFCSSFSLCLACPPCPALAPCFCGPPVVSPTRHTTETCATRGHVGQGARGGDGQRGLGARPRCHCCRPHRAPAGLRRIKGLVLGCGQDNEETDVFFSLFLFLSFLPSFFLSFFLYFFFF